MCSVMCLEWMGIPVVANRNGVFGDDWMGWVGDPKALVCLSR